MAPPLRYTSDPFNELNPRDKEEEAATEPIEAMQRIMVDKHNPNKILKVGSQLEPGLKMQLVDFLRSNLDVFAWTHAGMTDIYPKILCHALNMDPSKVPVKQKI